MYCLLNRILETVEVDTGCAENVNGSIMFFQKTIQYCIVSEFSNRYIIINSDLHVPILNYVLEENYSNKSNFLSKI